MYRRHQVVYKSSMYCRKWSSVRRKEEERSNDRMRMKVVIPMLDE